MELIHFENNDFSKKQDNENGYGMIEKIRRPF